MLHDTGIVSLKSLKRPEIGARGRFEKYITEKVTFKLKSQTISHFVPLKLHLILQLNKTGEVMFAMRFEKLLQEENMHSIFLNVLTVYNLEF